MTGMKRGCCGKSYKDGAVAGRSCGWVSWKKVALSRECNRKRSGRIKASWMYGAIFPFFVFFFKKQTLSSRAQMPKQLRLKKLHTVCFLGRDVAFHASNASALFFSFVKPFTGYEAHVALQAWKRGLQGTNDTSSTGQKRE